MYDSHARHIVPMLGRRPMAALRRTDISAFVVDLTRKQLATATVVTIYRVLAMILRSAVHDRLLAASSCYKIELSGMPPRRLQALTADQVGDPLEHAPPRDYAVLALGVRTGMRQGEVLVGLRLPHLRLLARELPVEQQCRVVPGGPPEVTDEIKTAASRRVLPLPARHGRPVNRLSGQATGKGAGRLAGSCPRAEPLLPRRKVRLAAASAPPQGLARCLARGRLQHACDSCPHRHSD